MKNGVFGKFQKNLLILYVIDGMKEFYKLLHPMRGMLVIFPLHFESKLTP